MAHGDVPYATGGNQQSQQAEPSSANRGGGTLDIRILVELQVISMLLAQAYESTEDLRKLRQDVSDSIT
jgi:hypothetical protein